MYLGFGHAIVILSSCLQPLKVSSRFCVDPAPVNDATEVNEDEEGKKLKILMLKSKSGMNWKRHNSLYGVICYRHQNINRWKNHIMIKPLHVLHYHNVPVIFFDKVCP